MDGGRSCVKTVEEWLVRYPLSSFFISFLLLPPPPSSFISSHCDPACCGIHNNVALLFAFGCPIKRTGSCWSGIPFQFRFRFPWSGCDSKKDIDYIDDLHEERWIVFLSHGVPLHYSYSHIYRRFIINASPQHLIWSSFSSSSSSVFRASIR